MNSEKYRIDAACPTSIKGGSTGFPPIQVSTRVFATRDQNRIRDGGRNARLRCFDV